MLLSHRLIKHEARPEIAAAKAELRFERTEGAALKGKHAAGVDGGFELARLARKFPSLPLDFCATLCQDKVAKSGASRNQGKVAEKAA